MYHKICSPLIACRIHLLAGSTEQSEKIKQKIFSQLKIAPKRLHCALAKKKLTSKHQIHLFTRKLYLLFFRALLMGRVCECFFVRCFRFARSSAVRAFMLVSSASQPEVRLCAVSFKPEAETHEWNRNETERSRRSTGQRNWNAKTKQKRKTNKVSSDGSVCMYEQRTLANCFRCVRAAAERVSVLVDAFAVHKPSLGEMGAGEREREAQTGGDGNDANNKNNANLRILKFRFVSPAIFASRAKSEPGRLPLHAREAKMKTVIGTKAKCWAHTVNTKAEFGRSQRTSTWAQNAFRCVRSMFALKISPISGWRRKLSIILLVNEKEASREVRNRKK